MASAPTQKPAGPAGAPPLLIMRMIFGYMLLLIAGIPVLLAFMFGSEATLETILSMASLESGLATRESQFLAVGALALLFAGWQLPLWLGSRLRRAAATASPGRPPDAAAAHKAALIPYVIRISLYESVAVIGLVLGILGRQVTVSLPFVLAALVMAVMSPPTQAAMARLAGGQDVDGQQT